MNMNPLISIITVTYNCEDTILRTIESVSTQSYKKYEHIIIDGASEDGTVETIRGYNPASKVKLFSEKDKGIYDAINKGVVSSCGDIVCLLHSGDSFLPGALSSIAQHYEQCSDKKQFALAASVRVCASNSYQNRIRSEMKPLSVENPKIQHVGIFLARKLYEEHGNYDIRFRVSADYNLIARMCSHKVAFSYTDEIFVKIEPYGFSAHPNQRLQKIWDHFRTQFKYANKVSAVGYALHRLWTFFYQKARQGAYRIFRSYLRRKQ